MATKNKGKDKEIEDDSGMINGELSWFVSFFPPTFLFLFKLLYVIYNIALANGHSSDSRWRLYPICLRLSPTAERGVDVRDWPVGFYFLGVLPSHCFTWKLFWAFCFFKNIKELY